MTLETPCQLLEHGTITGRGYRQLVRNGRRVYAHRVAWEAANGPIPEGLEVCHACDNPPCVNVEHLFLGTHKENMEDMARKGRSGVQRWGYHPVWGQRQFRPKRGADHGSAILTESQVRDVRFRHHQRHQSFRQIADETGVTYTNVVVIARGRSWGHLIRLLDIAEMPGWNPSVPNGARSITADLVFIGRTAGQNGLDTVSCRSHGATLCVSKSDAGRLWRCPACNEGAWMPPAGQ